MPTRSRLKTFTSNLRTVLLIALLALALAPAALPSEPDELQEFLGYTLIDVTAVPGEFEGGDFDEVVKMENGMLFEFTSLTTNTLTILLSRCLLNTSLPTVSSK